MTETPEATAAARLEASAEKRLAEGELTYGPSLTSWCFVRMLAVLLGPVVLGRLRATEGEAISRERGIIFHEVVDAGTTARLSQEESLLCVLEGGSLIVRCLCDRRV